MTIEKLLGPPGTGKTTALLSRLEQELATVPPEAIAFSSFTRIGAQEGARRALAKFGLEEKEAPYMRTLHSLAFKQLGLTREQVLGPEQVKYLGTKLGLDFSNNPTASDGGKADDILWAYYNMARDNHSLAETYRGRVDAKKYAYFVPALEAFKKQFGLYDFSDMVQEYQRRQLFCPVQVAVIDEAQDLTPGQWQFCSQAFRFADRIYIGGDDDQCLTSFAGADVARFLGVRAHKTTVLDQSYRIPGAVHELACRVSGNIVHRVKKDYKPREFRGEVHGFADPRGLELDREGSWFLLARNRWHLTRYTEHLDSQGYLYSIRDQGGDKPNLDPELVDKCRAHIAQGKRGHWSQAINVPLGQLKTMAAVLQRPQQDPARILVSTIHAVKGAEADHVAVLTDLTRQSHTDYTWNNDAELRVFYVGVTRARKTLWVGKKQTRYGYPDF